GAAPHEAAMLFDLPEPGVELAAFLVSRSSTSQSASEESNLAQVVLGTAVPEIALLSRRLSGSTITSLDGFDAVVGTTMEITTSATVDAIELREAVLPALLGRSSAEVAFTPSSWQGGRTRNFMLTMQTVHRAEDGQTVYLGAIARK